ncbi:alpha/beta fold hydrolase [Bradyrhizobium sp. Pha-3]|uniref:alpha/beta fold hydrolase n=1 Tax=Bradyrhizobium sp. Pha-3 TaxID=208375 RepID=UPI0035D5109A
MFSAQAKALASSGLSVVIPDLPGHGGSDDSLSPWTTYSFPGYADSLRTLMNTLGYRSFHIVGWSLGGHIGIEMWARYPAVRSLIVCGTPPIRLDAEGVGEGFNWTSTTALAGRKRFGSEETRRYVSAMMGRPLPLHHHLSRMAARTDGNARLWMVKNGLAGRGVDEAAAVSEIGRPIAVIQGSSDPFIRPDYLRRLRFANIWTGAPIFIDAGHAAHWEVPSAFNSLMMKFLKHASAADRCRWGHHGRDGRGIH